MSDKKELIKVFLITVIIIGICWGIVYFKNENGSNYTYTSSDYNNSSTTSSSTTTTTTAKASSYLMVSDKSISSNSISTICEGTIMNPSYSSYSFRFVKVKIAFLDSYGRTIDTTTTYAVGSEYLEPGESSKFKASVTKDTSIVSCTVTVID